jgi:hypothetical protein
MKVDFRCEDPAFITSASVTRATGIRKLHFSNRSCRDQSVQSLRGFQGAILDVFSNAVAIEILWNRKTPLLSISQTGNKRGAFHKRVSRKLADDKRKELKLSFTGRIRPRPAADGGWVPIPKNEGLMRD